MDKQIKLGSQLEGKWAIALGIVGLLVIGGATVYAFRLSQQRSPAVEAPTPIIPVVEAVSALGRIEPQGEVIKLAAPPTMGKAKVAELLVEEGELVEKGQIIAILDNHKLRQAEVEKAQKEVKVAQANLAIVKAGAKEGEIKAQEATIARLEAQLKGEIQVNQAKIAKLEAQLQREIEEQEATIDRLEAELRNAQIEFKRYESLAEDGAISTSNLDQRRLTLDTAQERVTEAKATYHKTQETLREQIKEAKAIASQSVDTLGQQIREAKAELNKIAEVRLVDIEQAEAEVERAIASMKERKADLDLTYVTAPFNSQVLKINTYAGEGVSEEDGIVELGKTGQMMVVAEVYESDISQVKLGQQATIRSENNSFPGELTGEVSHIALQIGKKDVLDTDPAADVDARVVEVKIALKPQSSKLVSNLTYSKVLVKILLSKTHN